MKKTVLTFGLISGAILSGMMLATLPFHDSIGFERAEVIGYTTIVAAFLLIFFGVRSYRDTVSGGTIPFGRAFLVGALIAFVASACYVVTWQVIYYRLAPDFGEKYQAYLLDEARRSGESDEAIARKKDEFARFAELYGNPAFNVAVTFLEPLPIGLVVSLVSAGILSRGRRDAGRATAPRTVVSA